MKKIVAVFFLNWIRLCASLQLTKVRPVIVGVTGSAGKSTTVVAIARVLQQKYRVKWTKKGNSETGIPLEILNIPIENFSLFGWIRVAIIGIIHLIFDWEQYDILVVEMGIDSEKSPKNMEYLLSFIRPKVGVFLNVNAVHALNFSGKDPIFKIAQEKSKLLSAVPENGLSIINSATLEKYKLATSIKSPIQSFSLEKGSGNIWLDKYQVSLDGTTFYFSDKEKQYEIRFAKQLHIKESFGGIASALLVGKFFAIPYESSIQRLEKVFSLPKGRMSVIEGIHDSTIIDSSYNSSPTATQSALEVLGKMHARKIAVLGDMRELGTNTEVEHQKLAKTAESNADEIIFIGPLTRKYSLPAISQKMKQHVRSFPNAYQALKYLENLVIKNDVILIKGSQNTIFLEIVVKALMRYPENAKKLLCRQTDFWEKERKKLLTE